MFNCNKTDFSIFRFFAFSIFDIFLFDFSIYRFSIFRNNDFSNYADEKVLWHRSSIGKPPTQGLRRARDTPTGREISGKMHKNGRKIMSVVCMCCVLEAPVSHCASPCWNGGVFSMSITGLSLRILGQKENEKREIKSFLTSSNLLFAAVTLV